MHSKETNHYAVYHCSYCVEPIELTSNGVAVYFHDTDKWVLSCDNCQTNEIGSPSFFNLDVHLVKFPIYLNITMRELEQWFDAQPEGHIPPHARDWLLSYADNNGFVDCGGESDVFLD